MFLLLEIFENPKKHNVFFWIFDCFNRKIQKRIVFLDFSIKRGKIQNKTLFFLDFQDFPKPKTSKIQKKTLVFLEKSKKH